jgi:tRNA pseudouridine55 synthase
MDGILLVDKPAGITSNRLLNKVRRWAGTPRVGHTGTLDPLATGLLPALIGKATLLAPYLPAEPKEYQATILFGITTESGDADGRVTAEAPAGLAPPSGWARLVTNWTGTISLPVPRFAAVKVDGRPLYRYARAGQPVACPVREMGILELETDTSDWPRVHARIACTTGTYVRSLAVAMGEAVGCGAHVTALRRTRIARWSVESSVDPDSLRPGEVPGEAFIGLDSALDLKALVLDHKGADHIATGRAPQVVMDAAPAVLAPGERFRFVDADGRLLAVARTHAAWEGGQAPPAFEFERVVRGRG